MSKSLEPLDKNIMNSLSFLDNMYVKVIIYSILILYSSTYFENINMYLGDLYKRHKFINIIILLLIVYLGRKCPVIGILLGVAYVITLSYGSYKEKFTSGSSGDSDSSSGGDDSENVVYSTNNNNSMYSNEDTVESFLPGFMENNGEEKKNTEIKIKQKSSDCKSLYTPEFESIGDVCSSVNTFKDELNAQGLNSPLGFNSNVIGSPL
jgi:hypothetical protein